MIRGRERRAALGRCVITTPALKEVMQRDASSISAEYQPKGSALNPSDTLDISREPERDPEADVVIKRPETPEPTRRAAR